MKLALAAIALLGCSNPGSTVFDAGPPDASASEGACPLDIATYCATHACPETPAEAIAELCAEEPEVISCGSSVSGWRIDIGSGYDFDDAGLRMIVSASNGDVSCLAGPPDAAVGICAQTSPSVCPRDASAE